MPSETSPRVTAGWASEITQSAFNFSVPFTSTSVTFPDTALIEVTSEPVLTIPPIAVMESTILLTI